MFLLGILGCITDSLEHEINRLLRAWCPGWQGKDGQ